MTRRHVHYEAAFEDYVRSRGWPYVPVDEQKKVIFSGARIKSFDFLVYPPEGPAWLADVKGRKFPYDLEGGKRYWDNWVTREDLDGLLSWESVFGEGFQAVLVFAYWLLGPPERQPTTHVHGFRNEYYSFLQVSASTYKAHARQRSPKWDTLSMSHPLFRELAKPIEAPETPGKGPRACPDNRSNGGQADSDAANLEGD
ncbi:MAG: HYExAFE family protein [Phycisphaerales bacterium]|nr:MAG: HYExAFE family protein [Phycisphaerales bacterium]